MMSKKQSKNTDGLKAHAEARNQESIKKVTAAIEILKRTKGKSINFKTVAEEAGVAKATLYNNAVLRERIQSLRAFTVLQQANKPEKVETPSIKYKDTLTLLRNEIRHLKDDKKKLILQLEELEELKDENLRFKKQLDIRQNK